MGGRGNNSGMNVSMDKKLAIYAIKIYSILYNLKIQNLYLCSLFHLLHVFAGNN